MTNQDQMRRLQQVAALLFDSKLTNLKATARAMQQTKDHLADLTARPVPAQDLPQLAMEIAALRYERWADLRRQDLNLALARQTAAWLDARDAARLAFGKNQALEAIAARLPKGTKR